MLDSLVSTTYHLALQGQTIADTVSGSDHLVNNPSSSGDAVSFGFAALASLAFYTVARGLLEYYATRKMTPEERRDYFRNHLV